MHQPDLFSRFKKEFQQTYFTKLTELSAKIKSYLLPEKGKNQIDIEIKNIIDLIHTNPNRYKFYDKWSSTLLENNENEEDEELLEDAKRFIYSLNDLAMFHLREERVDENKKPFILCVDEQSDAEVIDQTNEEERKRASLIALERFLTHSYYRPYYSIEDKKYKKELSTLDSFVIAATCHGLLFGELSFEEIEVFVTKKLAEQRNLDFKNTTNLKALQLRVLRKYQKLLESEIPEKEQFSDLTEVITN